MLPTALGNDNGFRGFTAPASLKHGEAQLLLGGLREGFRGFTAPASLKRSISASMDFN